MAKVVADDRLFNLYVVFCHHINNHNGRYICNESDYFDFLDKVKKTHEDVVRAVSICAPLTPKGMPYIMLRTGKMAATPSGEFYFTFDGERFGGGFDKKYIQKPRKIEPKPEEIALKKLKEQQNEAKIAKPKPAPQRWTKTEVLDLLTNQAHIVARMLGKGYDLFEPIHGEWIQRWLTNPKKHKIMIHQAHRNSYKSAALRLFTAIYMILYPLKTVIIVRKSEDAVKELVQGVSSILDTPLFHTFVDILYPDIKNKGGFKKTTDTALALNTNLNLSLSGEFQLRALGLGSSLTGKHSTMIITDDICVDSDRASVSEREFTKAKYREMMNILSDGKGFEDSWVLNIGTPWHEEDVFSLMDKGLPPKSDLQVKLENISSKKRTEKQNEVIRKLNMERGKFVYNCYQTGLMTQKDIDWKKQSLNDDVLFAANYMLDLVSDDECPFPKIQNIGKYSKTYFTEAYEVFAALDCSYGGEDGTSLSIGANNWETNETVVYGKLWQKIAIDENYLEVAEYMYDCGVQTLFLESNADKGLMGQKFRELGFNVVSYHEHANKHTKIISTIRPYWRENGDALLPCVQFVSETDENYLSQIHNYKKGIKHDDAPDNLACLLLHSKFGALSIRVT